MPLITAETIYERVFAELVREDRMGARLRFDEPLSKHSSLRIGGPAAVWVEPATMDELIEVLELVTANGLVVEPVGLGSNTLFADEGIDGVAIRLVGELADWNVVEEEGDSAVIAVEAGAVNAHLVRGLVKDGWVGAEFLALIPGTFGGAVALNAGTRDQELASVLVDADVVVFEEGAWSRKRLSKEELGMSYRHAELPTGAMVVSGRVRVSRGDAERAREKVRLDKERRNETQPYRLASVGSTFANPEGDYAGRLIEAAGLKGHTVGGARISSVHANFFINEADATAEDFIGLMALARQRVRKQFNVELRPEVRFVGFDGRQRMLEWERHWEEQGC